VIFNFYPTSGAPTMNGGPLLWLGRRKLPGRGEGASGLRFDSATRAGGGEPARAPSERP
jgi:hypothetical protein